MSLRAASTQERYSAATNVAYGHAEASAFCSTKWPVLLCAYVRTPVHDQSDDCIRSPGRGSRTAALATSALRRSAGQAIAQSRKESSALDQPGYAFRVEGVVRVGHAPLLDRHETDRRSCRLTTQVDTRRSTALDRAGSAGAVLHVANLKTDAAARTYVIARFCTPLLPPCFRR